MKRAIFAAATWRRPGKSRREYMLRHLPVEEAGDCLNWIGRCEGNSPKFFYGNAERTARRLIWAAAYGAIPANLFALPFCGNDLCVEPSHMCLRPVAQDQAKTARRDGDGRRFVHKLTLHERRAIFALIQSGMNQHDIAAQFGISQATVSRIGKEAP